MRLHVSKLVKSFGDKLVLDGCSQEFEKGKVYALLGRNGAGKTTFFSILAQELSYDEGSIYLEEEGISRPLSLEDLFFMVSEPNLPNFLTGREFISFFVDANRSRITNLQVIDSYFDQIDFDKDDRDRLIQEYSTGMKNKLQMIMFLIMRPHIILMDEPLTSLDVVVQLEMKKLIRSIHTEHIILFSTHIMQLAEDLCDEIVLLRKGKMTQIAADIHSEDIEEQVVRLLKDTQSEDIQSKGTQSEDESADNYETR